MKAGLFLLAIVGPMTAAGAAQQLAPPPGGHGSGRPPVVHATLRGPIERYYDNYDYPPAAWRAKAEGRTEVRLTISAGGRVSACVVTATSGSAVLDSTTCSILSRRARFRPARDWAGAPTEDHYATAIDWIWAKGIPPDPPGIK